MDTEIHYLLRKLSLSSNLIRLIVQKKLQFKIHFIKLKQQITPKLKKETICFIIKYYNISYDRFNIFFKGY